MGNGSVIEAGEFQRMTAGTGVTHSEFNGSQEDGLHLLQIWILPGEKGLEPGYEQRAFDDRASTLRLIAAPDGRDGALTIHQDAEVYSSLLETGQAVSHTLRPGRHAWVQLVRGALRLGDQVLRAGDGVGVSEEPELILTAEEDAELLLFDLP
jgi:redox-sensitive bicupin YhaK (pirin superfamily)